ncbi:MAG: hypothetical protein ACO23V_11780 [Chitinophagaceae bacterium]|jgi:hypothetical protein
MSDRSNLYRDIFNGKNQERWEEEQKHMPNQKWHKIMSFIKSSIRITGYALVPFDLVTAAIVLIFSEIVGILEELV